MAGVACTVVAGAVVVAAADVVAVGVALELADCRTDQGMLMVW